MPDVIELYNHQGELKKYIELKTFPQVGDYVKITIDRNKLDLFRTNLLSALSLDKSYEVLRVHHKTNIIIQDNENNNCHLRPSDYTLIKEVTDDELLNIKYRNDSLQALISYIKKTKQTDN